MFLWSCDRRRFVDFVANRKPLKLPDLQSADSLTTLSCQSDMSLVWRNPPVEEFVLPNAIIVKEGSTQDFLAWASTYFRHIRPLTAHCHILTPSVAQIAAQSDLPTIRPGLSSADIGLILAEGIAYSVGRIDLNRLPLSAFTRTLSFSYAATNRRYQLTPSDKEVSLELIKSGWISARQLSNQPQLDLPTSDIGYVWDAVLDAVAPAEKDYSSFKSDRYLVDALKGVRANGRIPNEMWTKFSDYFTNESTAELLEGPREARVRAVDMAIRTLASGQGHNRYRAFLIGYMASRIQPGNLDHFPLLFPTKGEFKESFLWYGACSGLTPETSVDNYGDGIGWLIKRELGRTSSWLDRPECDIALSEMEILFRSREGSKPNIQTLTSGSLKVELFPFIYTIVKWPALIEDYGSSAVAARQISMHDEDARLRQDVGELLFKIDESAKSLNAIRKQVEVKFGEKTPKNRNREK